MSVVPVREGCFFPAHDVGDADGEIRRDGAAPVPGVDPYPGWSQIRAPGSWDSQAGDQVCVVTA